MKKIVSLLLAMIMIFALAACGQSAAPAPAATEAPAAVEEPAAESAPVEEAAPAEEPAPETDALVVDTCILKEADDAMINNYSLLAVNPDAPFVDADGNAVADVELNTVGAAALINWLLSEEGQNLAANYGFEEYGEYLFYLKDGRPVSTAEIPEATEETKHIRLSTTTSVNDSGLLGYLLPIFEEKYGYEVEVYSAGTGKSIANAKMGNADLILVHSKKQEEAFIADGFSYVIDGMETERLNSFISRGDGSGTHTKELSLWPEELGITAEAESFKDYTDWYVSANTGMGACLVMAEEMGAYILTDKATFLTFVANDG